MSLEMTDVAENLLINRFFRNQAFTPPANVYLALHSAPTGDAGSGTEASGGSYSRQPVALAEPSDGSTSNTNILTFNNMPAGSWINASVWSDISAGEMWWHGPLPATKTTTDGQSISVAIGDLVLGFTTGSSATTYLRNKAIDHFLRAQSYVPAATIYQALYVDTVGLDGSGMQVSGGGYSRKALTLTPPVNGQSSSTAVIDFTVPTTAVTYGAITDAASGGNILSRSPLVEPLSVTSGDTVRFPLGAISYSVH